MTKEKCQKCHLDDLTTPEYEDECPGFRALIWLFFCHNFRFLSIALFFLLYTWVVGCVGGWIIPSQHRLSFASRTLRILLGISGISSFLHVYLTLA